MPLSLFLLGAWPHHEPFDDAYISYRYALDLIEGHGLVFNVGERVEGYTNPLWTLLIAAGLRLGFDGRRRRTSSVWRPGCCS